ncbi:MAG: feruloyl-CoA synthase [Betaproteobacteria bacterium]|nr:feruloyl-CoA synthase [Betaproteobacteria bacterium]
MRIVNLHKEPAGVGFAPPLLRIEKPSSDCVLLSSGHRLLPFSRCVGEWLEHWACYSPDQVLFAERMLQSDGGSQPAKPAPWRKVSYRMALRWVYGLGEALLDRGLNQDKPLAILSDNSIDHALLNLAAMHVGVPVVPVSAAYSLMSKDYAKLIYILKLIKPGLIYVSDGALYAKALHAALAALDEPTPRVLVSQHPIISPDGNQAELFQDWAQTAPGARVREAFMKLGADTVAKILFTSGSTGLPKGVINTQRMLCSNQQAISQLWPFLASRPPVIVDWLPWSHTFGGNHNMHLTLRHGGSLYIDHGKPAPGLIERTVENLKDIAPTLYFNVPRGFDLLLPFLEQDALLRARFFSELDLIFYAAAALPQPLWDRLRGCAESASGTVPAMVSAWGSTETAPLATSVHYPIDQPGIIGLPAPGVTVKMQANADKWELLVKGPNVTPGYFRAASLTAQAFDEEGFYRIGDAGRFFDPDQPARGLVFDGRIAEDFKLNSGTWVHVGELRVRVIAEAAPLIQDCVITGHDRQTIGLLIFPNWAACRSLCLDLDDAAPNQKVIADPRVREAIRSRLSKMASAGTGSSTYPTRAMLLLEPASIDANEMTDKGYINQRAVLDHRRESVARLYAAVCDPDVIVLC